MGRCSLEVQEYDRAKAYLLAWIRIGEKWIGDTWGEPRPTAPMDENEITDTEHRLWVEDLEDTEAEGEEGPGREFEEDNRSSDTRTAGSEEGLSERVAVGSRRRSRGRSLCDR